MEGRRKRALIVLGAAGAVVIGGALMRNEPVPDPVDLALSAPPRPPRFVAAASTTAAAETMSPDAATATRDATIPTDAVAPTMPGPIDADPPNRVAAALAAATTSPTAPPSPHEAAPGSSPPESGPLTATGAHHAACVPGTVAFPLFLATDVVMTLDSSPSMFAALPEVTNWLATSFEPALRKLDDDIRLILVADLNRVEKVLKRDPKSRPVPSSRGISITSAISSRDSFDVLLKSASPKSERSWLSATRPGSSLHIVILTDDDPVPRTAQNFVARLTGLAGGALGSADDPRFRVHALLGFRADATSLVLGPDHEVVTTLCGVNAGVDYQIVAQETGGLRSSMCNRGSLDAFTTAFIEQLRGEGAGRCHATLPEHVAPDRIDFVRATSSTGARYDLTRVADTQACAGQSQAYEIAGNNLLLCPDSCAALMRVGLTGLEFLRRCD